MTPGKTAKFALTALVALGMLLLNGGGTAGASSKTTTVKAVETEFHIALSKKSFRPGRYTFVAENKGSLTHALEITGPGLHHGATADIAPGKSANLNVTLQKGKYDLFCPVGSHMALGMNVNVVVGASIHTTSGKKALSKAPTGGVGY